MHLPLLAVLPRHEQQVSECPAVAASLILETAMVGEGTPEGAPRASITFAAALSEPLLADGDHAGEE